MATSPLTPAALRAELQSDPANLGYAAPLAAGDHASVAGLINATTYGTAYGPITAHKVLKWGAANGVRLRIEQAAAAAGPFAPGQPKDISDDPVAQSIALAVRDQLAAGMDLDLTDPEIVGTAADGGPYTPGAAAGDPGMLDALAAAGVLVDAGGAGLKDSLIAVGAAAASRATALWGYALATNPDGPAAVAITTDRIAAALGA
jgi:hypothetical protein